MPRTVLITGASSGIGAATARHLLDRGFEVFGTSRRIESLPADVPPVRWVAMDVCDDESVREGFASIEGQGAELDGLVCNAGFGVFGSVEELSMDDARQQFETNFFGVLRTVRAALPRMRKAARGRIVLVGSLAARAPIPFQAHYSATKAAVTTLAFALRTEVAPHGIRVSVVEPGDIDTGFNDAMDFGDHGASAYGERIARCEKVVRDSLPRAPGPEVVARVIERALTSRWPRARYTAGPDSFLVPLGSRLLPDWLMLRMVRSHFDV